MRSNSLSGQPTVGQLSELEPRANGNTLTTRRVVRQSPATRRVVRQSIVCIAAMLFTGCQGLPPAGTMKQQQSSAVVHDPFPQADLGPSDLVFRPPGFEQPLPQPVRNRIAKDAMPWLQIPGP